MEKMFKKSDNSLIRSIKKKPKKIIIFLNKVMVLNSNRFALKFFRILYTWKHTFFPHLVERINCASVIRLSLEM